MQIIIQEVNLKPYNNNSFKLNSNRMDNKRDSNYHIISHIGQGAYGQVYKGRKKQTGQIVAIKTMKKKGKTEKDLANMRQQIQILKKLKHQNIVLLLDSFETSTEFVMVTELGRGELFNIIEDDQYLSQVDMRKIAQQLIRALHYLHSNRITHRDMKPQNILICDNGIVKLCDFGFARHMSYNTQVLTSIKGTPLYMAPEMVKQMPYTHTADLWSLGVILFQLSTGSPPFTATNLLNLVDHIVNDPIKYPETLSSEFKGFLKGLLNKNPNERLGWPELLNHPFVRETQAQKVDRKKRLEKYNQWLVQNNYMIESISQNTSVNISIIQSKLIKDQEEKRDISPSRKVPSQQDDIWSKYELTASEEKGATLLRSDTIFLNKLLNLLSCNINEVLRTKDKKGTIQMGLKVINLIIIKGKVVQQKPDIIKDSNIPNYILNLLKSILKIDNGKNHIEFISDLVKTIGLLSKCTFDKTIGIEMVYLRSFIPLLPLISKSSLLEDNATHHSLIMSLVKCIGIFANNASSNHIRSFSFYKDILEVKFIQDCINFIQHLDYTNPTIKYIIQVFSALMHPFSGDITTFPWKRSASQIVLDFNEYSTMFECIRQDIINSLLEIDWITLFVKVFQLDDEGNHIVKVSILRIILQSIRQSKEYTEKIINDKFILKLIFSSLSVNEPIIQSTGCMIIAQLLKHIFKEKTKQTLLETFTSKYISQILEFFEKSKYNPILGISSLFILQQALTNDQLSFNFAVKFENPIYLKTLGELLNNPGVNKIEDMRLIEGSNYGCHVYGYYDSIIGFIHRFMMRYNKDHGKILELCKLIEQIKLDDKLLQILLTLSSKSDLSPKGLITLLMICHDLMIEWKPFNVKLFDDSVIKSLMGLLRQSQIVSIQEWPANIFGGGNTCLQLLAGNLMKLFINGLQVEKEMERMARIFYNGEIVKLTINLTKYLNKEGITSTIPFLCRLAHCDDNSKEKEKDREKDREKDTRNQDREFIKQIIEQNGLKMYNKFDLLGLKSTTPLILEALSLISQIARVSEQYYKYIDEMQIYSDLHQLISHTDPVIRSRVLNLIGNLCRHTKYFYKILQKQHLISECISKCSDNDKLVRKFACVVIGNAAFYDDSLYETLKPSISLLVNLLKDSEEKTRSNAAAALGNLARNSDVLDYEFIRTGAIQQLVSLLVNDKSLTTKRIVLVSLNNLIMLPECGKQLYSNEFKKVVGQVLAQNGGDQGIVKNATKIIDKLT